MNHRTTTSLLLLSLSLLVAGCGDASTPFGGNSSASDPIPKSDATAQGATAQKSVSSSPNSNDVIPVSDAQPATEDGHDVAQPAEHHPDSAERAAKATEQSAEWTPILRRIQALVKERGNAEGEPELGVWRQGAFEISGKGLPCLRVKYVSRGIEYVSKVVEDAAARKPLSDLIQRATITYIDASDAALATYQALYESHGAAGRNHSVKTHVEFDEISGAQTDVLPIDVWQTSSGSLVLSHFQSRVDVAPIHLVITGEEADLNADGDPSTSGRGTEYAAAIVRGMLLALSGKQ